MRARKAVVPRLRPSTWTGRIVGLVGQRHQRDDDRDQDALERAEQHDAGKGAHRPTEFDAADATDGA